MEPRSAGAMGIEFPYTLPTMCYIEIQEDGTVTHGVAAETYQRTLDGKSRLFAVWPGQWRSDLFAIDDLDQYARAVGIIHDEERTGLADHQHDVRWSLDSSEDRPMASYITIRVWLDCGCSIRDLQVFADHMRRQQGWDIATTAGWGGGSGGSYMRVRRKSLSQQ